ncbi:MULTISPECIES: hypothetical protein [unclassified Streptomyces]|uniref:hypothetical protein n=1 Tax=unclassified Streptomyces TaxID=2593676 RepID=UPI0038276AFA
MLKLLTSPETDQRGGWKHPECEVWAGALNHADLDALKQRVFEMPWREPNLALAEYLIHAGGIGFGRWPRPIESPVSRGAGWRGMMIGRAAEIGVPG